MIVSGRDPNHLFIVLNWKVIHKIIDPDVKNVEKISFTLFPSFSLERFPFMVISGESSINIVNVSTGYEDVLIKARRSVDHLAQTACFFTTDSNKVITMHFTTSGWTEEGKWR